MIECIIYSLANNINPFNLIIKPENFMEYKYISKEVAHEMQLYLLESSFKHMLSLQHETVGKWIQYVGCKRTAFNGITLIFKSSNHPIYFECVVNLDKRIVDEVYNTVKFMFTDIYNHFRALKYSLIPKHY